MLRGSCNCGGVRFEIEGRVSPIGMCHCSLCRKASGTAGNAVLLTADRSLRWTEGRERARTWERPSGWGVTFCDTCGSPLPRRHPSGKVWWVPAGLLDNDPGVAVAQHIFVGSKAPWDEIAGAAERHDEWAPHGPPTRR